MGLLEKIFYKTTNHIAHNMVYNVLNFPTHRFISKIIINSWKYLLWSTQILRVWQQKFNPVLLIQMLRTLRNTNTINHVDFRISLCLRQRYIVNLMLFTAEKMQSINFYSVQKKNTNIFKRNLALSSPSSFTTPLGRAKRLLCCAVKDVWDSGTLFAGHILNWCLNDRNQYAVCHERERIVQYVEKRVC